MYSFRKFIEVNYDPTQYISSLQQNKDFSLPTAGAKLVGKTIGSVPAALSGLSTAYGEMQSVRSKFLAAQKYVLWYLKKTPQLREMVLDKVEQAISLISSRETGVNKYQTSMKGNIGQIGQAVWRGVMASVRNLFDTWLGRAGTTDERFNTELRNMLLLLSQMPKDLAFPFLKQFEHVLKMGGTAAELDQDALRS